MMPTSIRSSWKGAISFGLVTVPVQLYPATREHNLPLHQVHVKDGGRVRMKRFCEVEDREVPYEEIGRGYESPGAPTVVLSSEDLAALPLPSKKVIDVLAFLDAGEIDPLTFSKAYYVGTDQAGAKPYALLHDALADANLVAVTKVTLSTRESLAVLRAHGDVLVLQTMLWPDELRPATDIAPDAKVEVRPQELAMARSLMDTLSEGFDLAGMQDEYQAALKEVVEARLEGAEITAQGPPRESGDNVIDLMAALQRSVAAAETARSDPKPAPARGKDAPAPPAKKAAGRSAPGRKASKSTSTKAKPPAKAAARKGTASQGTKPDDEKAGRRRAS
jgi:DNA end-binding protein Ku